VSAYALLSAALKFANVSKDKNKNKRYFPKFLFLLFLHINDIFNKHKGKFYFVNLQALHAFCIIILFHYKQYYIHNKGIRERFVGAASATKGS